MKVYEKINLLKGTDATPEEMKSWAYMNRVEPCNLENELELENGIEYPPELKEIQLKVCNEVNMDCYKCRQVFFDKEIETQYKNDNYKVIGVIEIDEQGKKYEQLKIV